jgi:hypothetical protein
MFTQYLHHIHPPMPFPHLLPLPIGTIYPDRICFPFDFFIDPISHSTQYCFVFHVIVQ